MELPACVEELNKAAKRHSLCRNARWYALWELLVGSAFLLLPWAEPERYNFGILVPAGAYFLLDGGWNLVIPTITFRARQGLSLIPLLGGGHGLKFPLHPQVPWAQSILVGCVCLLFVIFLVEMLVRWLGMPADAQHPPSSEARQWIRDVVREISKVKPKQNLVSDIVAFNAGGTWARAKLLGDMALFVHNRGEEIRLVHRDEVNCDLREQEPIGEWIKVVFHIGDWDLKGRIKPQFLRRFQEWKSSGCSRPETSNSGN